MIGLAKTFAPFFKKRPERLAKPAALDTLVFFKIVKMKWQKWLKTKLKIKKANSKKRMSKISLSSKLTMI